MKHTFTYLTMVVSCIIMAGCQTGQTSNNNNKEGIHKPKDNICSKFSIDQFKICLNKQKVMSKNFNTYFGIADPTGGSPISFSTNLYETLPDSSLHKLYNYTTDNDTTLPGLRIYYGLDNSNNIVYIYQPVNMAFDSVNTAGDTAYYSITEVGGKWRKDTTTRVSGLDSITEANANKAEKNYLNNTLVYRNVLGDFSHLNTSADAQSITFPWIEFDTLARENCMENAKLSRDEFEKIINLHSIPDVSNKSVAEIVNEIIRRPNTYMNLYGIIFTTGAEMYSNDTSFQHTITLAPLVVNTPVKHPGTLTNMDANMGAMCPPNCHVTTYALKK